MTIDGPSGWPEQGRPMPPPPVLPPPPSFPPPPVVPVPTERSPLARALIVVAAWHGLLGVILVAGAIYLGVESQGTDCDACPAGPLASLLVILVVGPTLIATLLMSTAIVAMVNALRRWLPWLTMAAAVVVPPALFALVVAPYLR